jgi:hypothetical protein
VDISDYDAADVFLAAGLRAFDVAVTHECHGVVVDANDAMQHIGVFPDFSQYGITGCERGGYRGEYHAVSLVLKERSHTTSLHGNGAGVSLPQSFLYSSQKNVVGYLKNLV